MIFVQQYMILRLLTMMHGKNFMEVFTTLSLPHFTMRVVIYEILSMAIIPTLSTSILFCNLCYILL